MQTIIDFLMMLFFLSNLLITVFYFLKAESQLTDRCPLKVST